jgi:hypothetical protein
MITRQLPFGPCFRQTLSFFASAGQALHGVAGNDDSWIERHGRFDCGHGCHVWIRDGMRGQR